MERTSKNARAADWLLLRSDRGEVVGLVHVVNLKAGRHGREPWRRSTRWLATIWKEKNPSTTIVVSRTFRCGQ